MWPQFPDQGLNPCPQHWEHGVLTTGPQGSPLYVTLPKVRWGGSRKWLDLASLSLTASLATPGLSGSGMGTGPPHMSSELEWAGRPSFSDSRQWLEFVWVSLVDGQLLDSSLYYQWALGCRWLQSMTVSQRTRKSKKRPSRCCVILNELFLLSVLQFPPL